MIAGLIRLHAPEGPRLAMGLLLVFPLPPGSSPPQRPYSRLMLILQMIQNDLATHAYSASNQGRYVAEMPPCSEE